MYVFVFFCVREKCVCVREVCVWCCEESVGRGVCVREESVVCVCAERESVCGCVCVRERDSGV